MDLVDAPAEPLADAPRATSVPPPELPADRFSDRELSWLAFNQRVLELAEDTTQPLLGPSSWPSSPATSTSSSWSESPG
jgi:Polyphosphate kinase N-terminal domain